MPDPTLKALADLDDPTLYAVYADVPVFRAHRVTKTTQGGKSVTVEVTDADLATICERVNRLAAESGVPARITPGHTHPGVDVPEGQQPEPWGYARDFYVGTFGPGQVRAVLARRYYLRKDRVAEARTYPYRSAEYYPPTKEITGVALLRRDPELDLGIVTYDRGEAPVCFALENTMADDPTTPPDAAAPSQEEQDGFMRMLKHCAPKLYEMGFPGVGNTAVPGEVKDPEKPEADDDPKETDAEKKDDAARMSREADAIRYARVEGEVKALREQNAALAYRAEEAACEQAVTQLEGEGYLIRDRAKLVKQLAKMLPGDREARLDDIRTHYQRDPARGPYVHVAEAAPGAPEKETTREQRDAAVSLAYRRNISFDDALAEVKKAA